MNILYIGDVMGEAGVEVVETQLPKLKRDYKIDLAIAQVENVTEGKGITPADFRRLEKAGVDFGAGGNWSLRRSEIFSMMSDRNVPIIRPANLPKGTPGLGYKYIRKNQRTTLVISLLGGVVGRDADKPTENPLLTIDAILEENRDVARDATIVNFHGDYSSEKVVIGHYLDGRVTAVIGDHWHVPTADARVMPNGTAHMTDIGMCGALNSSLGVAYDSVVPRWRDGKQTRNLLETKGPRQFNALLIQSDPNGLASSVQHIQKILT